MTSKERVHAALEGKPVDSFPVTMLYSDHYYHDHFVELTSKEQCEIHLWLHSEPEEYIKTYRIMVEKVPFEILHTQCTPLRSDRKNIEFIRKNGKFFCHDKKADTYQVIESKPLGQHYGEGRANQTQYVFCKEDVNRLVKIVKAEEIIASGCLDHERAVAKELGRDYFIVTSWLNGALQTSTAYLGQENALRMLVEKPDLMDYLNKKLLEQTIERIRAYCSIGGDGISIDDALATSDVISVEHYERFSLPYMKAMVKEIHRLGHKAILIYFGGIADRLEQIAAIGADGLSMETSMKGYVNDIDDISEKIGSRITLFGNIDPVGVLQDGTDEEMEAEIRRQAAAGKKARGFIMCTGSPITPVTPLARVQKFLELGKRVGDLSKDG